ncbi:MAG: YbjN domain-containing protein [Gammaproteobacteria bacterium]|nr:YbjN domain-containing protein [Gammaproteobacteria bacterium]
MNKSCTRSFSHTGSYLHSATRHGLMLLLLCIGSLALLVPAGSMAADAADDTDSGPLLPAEPAPPATPQDTPEADDNDADADAASASGAPMNLERLHDLLLRIDPALQRDSNVWQFRLRGRQMITVADANADRMRIMSPVIESGELDEALMFRLLQANFDSALDARYAVANDVLWSVFIHPLSPLDEQQLSSGVFQTFTAAATFGTLFSSGMFIYGGGDSNEELEQLQQELDALLKPTI